MSKPKVILAFSGGLDTSFCVKYLTEERGMEVHSALVDTGGFSPAELKTIEEKAYSLGVTSHSGARILNTTSKRTWSFPAPVLPCAIAFAPNFAAYLATAVA